MNSFNPKNMTYSGLQRFVEAVDMVMDAEQLDHRERTKLIAFWAYQFHRKDMPEQLAAAILRCQSEACHPTASSVVDSVTGEVVAYASGGAG